MRGGRALEVRGYGDAGGHPVIFFHGLIGSHHQASYIGGPAKSTLGTHVFTRGVWHAGDVKTFTHQNHVIPVNLQTERLGAKPKRQPLV
jgi:hypothetical protein